MANFELANQAKELLDSVISSVRAERAAITEKLDAAESNLRFASSVLEIYAQQQEAHIEILESDNERMLAGLSEIRAMLKQGEPYLDVDQWDEELCDLVYQCVHGKRS